jgi:oxygen-independent coproporphyrinogen-3 oxidase
LAGIYLHIPFCRQACAYCNFHFSTSLRYKDELLAALSGEAEKEKGYLGGDIIETIYFGGGTPSLLALPDLETILGVLHQHYEVRPDAEVTLEANPDDITPDQLRGWKNIGINRLSIGVQSFNDEELRWMNRAHNSRQSLESLALASALFSNITIDLIYGSPLLNDERWAAHVETATGLGIPHLSCYALTVEEKTPLHRLIRHRKALPVDEERQARQFLWLMQRLREKGYEHYEVSNFAQPGYRSRHNTAYWKGVPYLGLGPSAHSYNGAERRWNVAHNALYIKGITQNAPQRERESLSVRERLHETIMISLRTREGLDLGYIEAVFGAAERQRIGRDLQAYVRGGLVRLTGSVACLTDEGMLRADGIAAALFLP